MVHKNHHRGHSTTGLNKDCAVLIWHHRVRLFDTRWQNPKRFFCVCRETQLSQPHLFSPLVPLSKLANVKKTPEQYFWLMIIEYTFQKIQADSHRYFLFRPTAVHPLTATVRSLLPVFTLRSRLRSWLAKNLLPQASPKLFFQDPTHTQTSKWVTIKSW